MRINILRRQLLASALGLAASFASAQTFPGKPIRIVVGYSAGGGVGAMARLLAQRVGPLLGQQVIVDNRAGAAGMIAADLVSKAPPDGHTLLLSDLLVAPYLQTRSSFDLLKAFTPIAGAFITPLVVIANNNVPVRNANDLVALLKANPGKYSYATPGIGTIQHLSFELLKARTNSFIVHIPYRGASQVVPDVISGQVPLAVVSAAAGLAQARAGRVRAVAMLGNNKLVGGESISLMSEALPGFDVAPRLMLFAPPGTPADVIQKLDDTFRAVLSSAEVAQATAQQGAIPSYLNSAALAADVGRESLAWQKIIRDQNLTGN